MCGCKRYTNPVPKPNLAIAKPNPVIANPKPNPNLVKSNFAIARPNNPNVVKLNFANARPILNPNVVNPHSNDWQPILWKILHIIAEFGENKPVIFERWKHIIIHLSNSLPCDICKNHLSEWIKKNPLTPDISSWILNLHNNINIENKKHPWTKEQVSSTYGGDRVSRIKEAEQSIVQLSSYMGIEIIIYLKQ